MQHSIKKIFARALRFDVAKFGPAGYPVFGGDKLSLTVAENV